LWGGGALRYATKNDCVGDNRILSQQIVPMPWNNKKDVIIKIYFLLAVCIVSFNLQAATPEQDMFDDLYLRISPNNHLLTKKSAGSGCEVDKAVMKLF